jgi:hypothetical protein
MRQRHGDVIRYAAAISGRTPEIERVMWVVDLDDPAGTAVARRSFLSSGLNAEEADRAITEMREQAARSGTFASLAHVLDDASAQAAWASVGRPCPASGGIRQGCMLVVLVSEGECRFEIAPAILHGAQPPRIPQAQP